MLTTPTADPIEKEKISDLRFSNREPVHLDPEALRKKLELATRMGNIDHVKVRIIFKDDETTRFTETTIWATLPQHIVLKGGVTIPFQRILDVKLI